MNKVAKDLQNYAPQAPVGMEDRIQKALSKKKSFWSFSWYTMNVFVVALIGAGVLALVFVNSGGHVEVAQSLAPTSSNPVAHKVDYSAPSASLNVESMPAASVQNDKPSSLSSNRTRSNESQPVASSMINEDSVKITCVTPPLAEFAETVEVQKMPEEIQVPKAKTEVVKAKGRPLKLTRLTGK